jgi:hypothetical protein
MFSLPDLPICDALALPQVGQKGFNILSGPVYQRFTLEKTLEVLHPPDIEGRAVWAYPVLLRAPPVGLPKTISLFGIVDIHDVHLHNPFNVNRLGKNSTFMIDGIIISQYNISV